MRPSVVVIAGCFLIMVSGCASDPGSMSKSEIEVKLKDKLNLKEVSLKERPEGGYTGTARKEDGTKYTITVTQQKEDRSLWYAVMTDKGELTAGGFKDFSWPGITYLRSAKGLLILFAVIWGGIVVAPALVRRFGKTAVLKWGTITVVALALSIIGMAIVLLVSY